MTEETITISITTTPEKAKEKLPALLQAFGDARINIERELVAPSEAAEEPAPAPVRAAPGKRGRPPKTLSATAPTAPAAVNGGAAEEDEVENGETATIDNDTFLAKVRDFRGANPGIGEQLKSLLREYGASQVTGVPEEQRVKFLAEMNELPMLS